MVSVVTPSLNQGRFIEDAIRSLGCQNYPHLEHIVVDGGSTDETLQVLRRHDRLVWCSEPDQGQSDAVNKGLGMARGEILGWLNADDTYLPGTVAAAVRYLRDHPEVGLVYGDCYVVDAAGRLLDVTRSPPRPSLGGILTFDQSVPQAAAFFRRSVVETVGGLDPGLHLAMDVDFIIRVARRGRLAHVPTIRSTIRFHETTKSHERFREVLPELLRILGRVFDDATLPAHVAALRTEAFAAAYVGAGIRAYNRGARSLSRHFLMKGLRLHPHPLRLRTLKGCLLFADTILGTGVGACLRSLLHRARYWQARRYDDAAKERP